METSETSVDIRRVKNGWAAYGDWWAVHGDTREEAVRRYYEAIERHKEIGSRPIGGRGALTPSLAAPNP